MAVTLIGKAHIYSLDGLAIGIAALAGYVSPKFDSLNLTNAAQFEEEMSQAGDVDALYGNQRGVICTFRFKPKGSTIANAKLSAGIPAVMAGVTITGLPIIAFGGFTDVYNTNAGNTQPWIFDGNASHEGPSDSIWTATLTLRRYIGITSATAIT